MCVCVSVNEYVNVHLLQFVLFGHCAQNALSIQTVGGENIKIITVK